MADSTTLRDCTPRVCDARLGPRYEGFGSRRRYTPIRSSIFRWPGFTAGSRENPAPGVLPIAIFYGQSLRRKRAVAVRLWEAVIERWRPRSFLDVGCGTGKTLEYVASKGIDCLGLEGSRAAIAASPVKQLIRLSNLNRPVDLGRKFEIVWSYEVAEHIHPLYTDTFLATLTRHGDLIVMSAAQPGQGGAGHFNEQPPSYWIQKMRQRGYSYDAEFSEFLHSLPAEYSRNMMVFARAS